jgi:hypothetical protein
MGQVGANCEPGRAGSNLDVANAIRDYLARAQGDTRLALAMSVADGLAVSRQVRGVDPTASSRAAFARDCHSAMARC